jgi:Aerotolerance regulator N-terminal
LPAFVYICLVSFAYPFFLAAVACLAIPVLIHLFNLRRYKTVLFPNVRFLKNVQLSSRKQSQLRYKWLLAARLLFLALLVLAFAQPFFKNKNNTATGNHLQVIYIDNSYSMSVKKGIRTVLDIAKEVAGKQIKQSPPGTKFIVIDNDRGASYQPEPADKALIALNRMDVSAESKTVNNIFAYVQSLLQSNGGQSFKDADLYYYSDFQKTMLSSPPEKALTDHIDFYGIPVQNPEAQNVFIDTAYLTTPALLAGQSNKLVVVTRAIGTLPRESPVVQLAVNSQVKSAATLNFSDKKVSIDTLSFSVNNANWQQVQLSVNDAAMHYDDTFRIAARSTPSLSVLVLNEGQPNPFISAAFRSYDDFRVTQYDIGSAPADWKNYNLVLVNGVTHMDDPLAKRLSDALADGQSICIFPGRTSNYAALSAGLNQLGGITLNGEDTALQAVASVQEGSNLVKDIFEKMPENVQLPIAKWHYIIHADINANQQSILSFRNGDPYFARYMPTKGQLYLLAGAADLEAGNFTGSYFFAPFLYEMAMQTATGSAYAITAGRQQPIYVPLSNAMGRSTVHLTGKGLDAIPPQRPNGAGVDIFADEAVKQPGYYQLMAPGNDTVSIALNADRAESKLEDWSIADLKKLWKGDRVHWIDIGDNGGVGAASNESFPLWKLCVLAALLMLCMETYLLIRPQKVSVAA